MVRSEATYNLSEKPAKNRQFLKNRKFICTIKRVKNSDSNDTLRSGIDKIWPELEQKLDCPSKFKTHLSHLRLTPVRTEFIKHWNAYGSST